jgi:DNA mismatch endonuclease (patch repair protein)
MRAIRSKDTGPERFVRSVAHNAGFRFRLHRKDLPGKPDLVFPKWRAVIFVHGCYWHGHGCARGGKGAKSNQEYWAPKLKRTRERDQMNAERLETLGWRVLTLWECETKDCTQLLSAIRSFLMQR